MPFFVGPTEGTRHYRPFVSTPLVLAARAVVNAEDPIGLLAMDAAEDEYDPEVRDFVKYRTDRAARAAAAGLTSRCPRLPAPVPGGMLRR